MKVVAITGRHSSKEIQPQMNRMDADEENQE
jgi:hypothetical protein